VVNCVLRSLAFNFVSRVEVIISFARQIVVSRVRISSGDSVNINVFGVGTLRSVDLKSMKNIVHNNFSFNNSSSLIEVISRCKDGASDCNSIDVDGSSTSENVKDNTSTQRWETSSRKCDVSSSSDVNNEGGLEVAVVQDIVSRCSQLIRGDGHRVGICCL